MMPKLSEKFVTDSDFEIGLALFITKKLVEANGGRIWADINNKNNNNDGIGSTIHFFLMLNRNESRHYIDRFKEYNIYNQITLMKLNTTVPFYKSKITKLYKVFVIKASEKDN
jgi:hypothetical protein